MLPPRAYVFIGLNIIRALSIISLILVFSSSIMTLVEDVKAFNTFQNGHAVDELSSDNSTTISRDYVPDSTVPNQPAGVFWAVLNRLLIIGQVIILFLSEIGWPSAFFDRYFPVLGDDFGLGALGIIQCLIGAAILSHHVTSFTLVSAFFLFSLGCLNMLVGLIFRAKGKPRRSITAWKERAKDVLPPPVLGGIEKGMEFSRAVGVEPPQFMSNVFDQAKHIPRNDTGDSGMSKSTTTTARSGLGFGRQGEKAAELKGFLLTRPVESLPRYAPKPVPSEQPAPTFQSSTTAV
jgi:hypothetical protein